MGDILNFPKGGRGGVPEDRSGDPARVVALGWPADSGAYGPKKEVWVSGLQHAWDKHPHVSPPSSFTWEDHPADKSLFRLNCIYCGQQFYAKHPPKEPT